jgi:vitamin B12 transporter
MAGVTTGALLAMPAVAQETAPGGADESDAIIVLGARLEESTPEELAVYGSRLEVIDGETIDLAGHVDLSGALRNLVPGLYLAQKSGAFDYVQVSLTGSRTSEVLFLVDGVRINNRLYASTSPLDTIPANMIERVEVLKGGQGLYYGTQAVGGIVNVITKSFTNQPDARLEVGYDTNNGYHASGYARGSTGDHYFVGFASHDQANGIQPFRDEDLQPSAFDRERGYRVTTVGGKYAFQPSDSLRLSASYQHVDARLDFAKAEDNVRNWNERNEEIASLKIDWAPTDRLDIYVKGYWHDWDSTYLDLRPVLVEGLPTSDILTVNDGEQWGYEDKGINVLGEFEASEQVSLVAGYDFQTYSGFDDVFLIAPSSESVHAPFAQVKLDLGDLHLSAGARHNMPSDGREKTVWNVSGRYGADRGLFVRGQVGTAFRLPTAYELYVIDPCCERGNPNLVAEESFNVEGGIGFGGDRFNLEAIGFWRRVENLINIDYDLPAFPDGLIVNTGDEVKVWGGELVASARLTDQIGLTFDYTHTEAEMAGGGAPLVNIPRDLVKVIADVQSSDGRFGGSASLNWAGDVYSNVAVVGRVNHGNYAVVDLSAWAFLDRDRRHRVGLRLENAFDADYDTTVTRAREDVTNVSYAAGFRGTPITLHATYSISL